MTVDDDIQKLQVRGLIVDLGDRRILDGIDLEVHRGETLVVLGPSGSGKSMLLRTIVRLTDASGGLMTLDGVPIDEMEPVVLRRMIALVQQNPAMLEGSVQDNLRFGPDLADVPEDEVLSRVRASLEDSSLDETFLHRSTQKLSGGERQRVAIARALAMRPEVLLLDEPTAALDPRTTRTVEKAILRIKEEGGLAMIIVTHDVDQAKRLGDRTVLLRMGRVIAEGDSQTLLDDLDPKEREMYLGELERWDEKSKEAVDCE